jgi:hypothetical protein
VSTRAQIRAVRAEIADMHEQAVDGMWGDYGEPMLVGTDLDRTLEMLASLWPAAPAPALPGVMVLDLLDRLARDAEEEE